MKKLMSLSLCVLLVFGLLHPVTAMNTELEGAIAQLWLSGPTESIEKVLNNYTTSSDSVLATKASFHLSCFKLMQGEKAKASEILSNLEVTAKTDRDKDMLKSLKELLLPQIEATPENFNRKISLDFKDTYVRDILKIISKQSDTNIVVHKNVNEKITLTLKDATVMQALNSICAAADLRYENNDGIFIVMPKKNARDGYVKKEIMLAFLSPDEAVKLLVSSTGNASDIMIKATKNSVLLEGNPNLLEKLESFLQTQDKLGKAQKISVKIWKIEPGQKITMQEFSSLDEQARKKVAKIIAAPSIISLPGKESTIKVGSENDEEKDSQKESFSYSFSCIFHETGVTDRFRLIANVKVHGISFIKGEKHEISNEFAPTIEIMRNKWVVLPLNEDKEQLYLELQIANYVK